jgi:hypothetical protein
MPSANSLHWSHFFGPSLGRLFDLDDRCPESGDNWGTEPSETSARGKLTEL